MMTKIQQALSEETRELHETGKFDHLAINAVRILTEVGVYPVKDTFLWLRYADRLEIALKPVVWDTERSRFELTPTLTVSKSVFTPYHFTRATWGLYTGSRGGIAQVAVKAFAKLGFTATMVQLGLFKNRIRILVSQDESGLTAQLRFKEI